MGTRKGHAEAFMGLTIACGLGAYVFSTATLDNPRIARASASAPATGGSGPRIWDMMPPDEQAFIKAVLSSAEAYRRGQDDAQKQAAKAERAKKLCEIAQLSNVSRWIGTVQKLSPSTDGKSVVSIQITNNLYVETQTDSSSDAADKTLIAPDDPVFAKLTARKDRRFMRFSGEFAKSDADCVKEAGPTLEASMTAPQFIFHFSDATAL
jgi:hypothetical protein